MKVRLDDIPGGGLEVVLSGDEDILSSTGEIMESIPEVLVDPRIQGCLKLSESLEGVILTGVARATATLKCSRCLSEFSKELTVDLDFVINRIGQEAKPEDLISEAKANEIFVQGPELNLGELVLQELLLELPMKPLCRDECPGLCSRCGGIRGSLQCRCSEETAVDPRWAKLTKLPLD